MRRATLARLLLGVSALAVAAYSGSVIYRHWVVDAYLFVPEIDPVTRDHQALSSDTRLQKWELILRANGTFELDFPFGPYSGRQPNSLPLPEFYTVPFPPCAASKRIVGTWDKEVGGIRLMRIGRPVEDLPVDVNYERLLMFEEGGSVLEDSEFVAAGLKLRWVRRR